MKYRDDLDNYYDDEDANPGSLMQNSRSEPEEEQQPPAPRPYKCQLKPNVSLLQLLHYPTRQTSTFA